MLRLKTDEEITADKRCISREKGRNTQRRLEIQRNVEEIEIGVYGKEGLEKVYIFQNRIFFFAEFKNSQIFFFKRTVLQQISCFSAICFYFFQLTDATYLYMCNVY